MPSASGHSLLEDNRGKGSWDASWTPSTQSRCRFSRFTRCPGMTGSGARVLFVDVGVGGTVDLWVASQHRSKRQAGGTTSAHFDTRRPTVRNDVMVKLESTHSVWIPRYSVQCTTVSRTLSLYYWTKYLRYIVQSVLYWSKFARTENKPSPLTGLVFLFL